MDDDEAAVAIMPRPAVDATQVGRSVTPERLAFLNAAFHRHLGPEIRGDLAGIVDSYAKQGGHLSFNGERYETPERLMAFHRALGFDKQGVIDDLGASIVHLHYTYDSVIVEYAMFGTIAVELHGAPPGRAIRFPSCGVYQFDEAGEVVSERIYLDTGSWLPEPLFRP